MSIGGKMILLGAAVLVVLLIVVYGGGPAEAVTPAQSRASQAVLGSVAVRTPVLAPQPLAAVTTRVITPRPALVATVRAVASTPSPLAITMGKPIPAELAVFAEPVAAPAPPARVAVVRPRTSPSQREVTVKNGDTLTAIAARTLGDGTEWRRFMVANPGLSPDRLRVGQVLKIPAAPAARSRPAAKPAAAKLGQKTHRIGTGDTLTSIASTYYGDSTRWDDIFAANHKALGGNPDQLRVDVVIVIP